MSELIDKVRELGEQMKQFATKEELSALSVKFNPPPGRFVPADAPEGQEVDLMAKAAAYKISNPLRGPEKKFTSAYGKQFGDMRGFLARVYERGAGLKTYTGQSEGDLGLGGYLVPEEISYEIMRLVTTDPVIKQIATVLPMSTAKRSFLKQTTKPQVGWVDENGTKQKTTVQFGRIQQVSKTMAAIVKFTDELLRDSALDLFGFFTTVIAEALEEEIQRVALSGSKTANDPFDGVLHASGVNVVTVTGEADADAFLDLQFAVHSKYRKNGLYLVTTGMLRKIAKLKDTNGNPIWAAPVAGLPGTIWGKPYAEIELEYKDGETAKEVALFGDFKAGLLVSPHENMGVKISQDASDDESNAFTQDQTWMRFTQACSIDVLNADALAYMLN